MQSALDFKINENSKVTHESTKKERFLALFVELSELANATRTFKYWSKKKSEKKDILLEEYADGIHFFFSLALAFKLELPESIEAVGEERTLTMLFLNVFERVNAFYLEPTVRNFTASLSIYLTLGKALYFTEDDIMHAYDNKLMINYNRQETDY